ncbi:sensor histidine kinase [Streptomyces boluensis]|uniref:Oxygen sensor histidine kinase NreB n=1 Tax=Streptomyces boluensis TaxID=1775135 RepID=A0A964ULD4_9ACTN|nr:sensor histidine kinase [Streptomyces boluensis]NBE51344.1 sensor histidine kinase [Streptomyces boluensis]
MAKWYDGLTRRARRQRTSDTLDAATAHSDVERRWDVFLRRSPFAMLAVSAVLTFASAGQLLPSAAERWAAVGLFGAAMLLELWWLRASRGRRSRPSAVGGGYYGIRWGIAFAVSWLNPFAAFYAALGYFGAERLLPRRLVPLGLFASAITIAGSQSGGFPPGGLGGWGVFGAILAVHVALFWVFSQLNTYEEKRTRIHLATISELEETNTRLKEAMDENAALHAQLLVQAREAGVADERRRLAAEIHDTIAQGLTGIITQLQVVASTAEPALAERHLSRAADLARHSLGEARRSVQNLGPAALEHHGLDEALKRTVTEWGERTGVRAQFTVTGTAEPLHDEIEATLLRIAQEALSNAARHAAAVRVGVTLSYMAGEVALDVRDDGTGFDPSAVPARTGAGGFGLPGMRARAERVAGAVSVESEPGHGTAVSARVPLLRHDQ